MNTLHRRIRFQNTDRGECSGFQLHMRYCMQPYKNGHNQTEVRFCSDRVQIEYVNSDVSVSFLSEFTGRPKAKESDGVRCFFIAKTHSPGAGRLWMAGLAPLHVCDSPPKCYMASIISQSPQMSQSPAAHKTKTSTRLHRQQQNVL